MTKGDKQKTSVTPETLESDFEKQSVRLKKRSTVPSAWKLEIRTNMLERINEELKRRTTHVIRLFPNQESASALDPGARSRIHEHWIEAHRYLNAATPSFSSN